MPVRALIGPPPGPANSCAVLQCCLLQLAIGRNSLPAIQQALDAIDSGWFVNVFQPPTGNVPPGWFVASHPASGEILVCIRGTTNINQWAYHVIGSWGVEYLPPSGQYVHGAFRYSVEQFVKPTLDQVLANPPPGGWKRLTITGHSYGAGCAAVLGVILWDAGLPVPMQVCTFGTPRAWALPFQRTPPFPWLNVMGLKDAVCHLPPPWASLRTAVPTAISGVLGKLGIGAVGKFLASQGVSTGLSIPSWRHVGDSTFLTSDGGVLRRPADNDPPGMGSTIPPEGLAHWHLIDSFYWPTIRHVVAHDLVAARMCASELQAGDQIAKIPSAADPFIEWFPTLNAIRPASIQAAFPGWWPFPAEDYDLADGVDIHVALHEAPGTIAGAYASGGASMATWKYTAYVSWGRYGRSVSIHRTGPADFVAARADALSWVSRYAALFGDKPGGQPMEGQYFIGMPGSPVVEWLRISDPVNPRVSQRFRVPGSGGQGHSASATGFESDMPWVTVSMSLSAVAGTRVTRDVVSIVGQPDGVALGGGYNSTFMMQHSITFGAALAIYLDGILPPNNSGWGTMGRDYAAAPDVPVTDFSVGTDGLMEITANTATWLDSEFIQLKSTKVPYYNREWRVRLNTSGSYSLLGSRPAGFLVPTDGTGYRIRDANGVKIKTFYAYNEASTSFNPSDRVFISKRNPGAVYTPLASRRRRRTPVK